MSRAEMGAANEGVQIQGRKLRRGLSWISRVTAVRTHSLWLDILPEISTKRPTISNTALHCGDLAEGLSRCPGSAFATPTILPQDSGVYPREA